LWSKVKVLVKFNAHLFEELHLFLEQRLVLIVAVEEVQRCPRGVQVGNSHSQMKVLHGMVAEMGCRRRPFG